MRSRREDITDLRRRIREQLASLAPLPEGSREVVAAIESFEKAGWRIVRKAPASGFQPWWMGYFDALVSTSGNKTAAAARCVRSPHTTRRSRERNQTFRDLEEQIVRFFRRNGDA